MRKVFVQTMLFAKGVCPGRGLAAASPKGHLQRGYRDAVSALARVLLPFHLRYLVRRGMDSPGGADAVLDGVDRLALRMATIVVCGNRSSRDKCCQVQRPDV